MVAGGTDRRSAQLRYDLYRLLLGPDCQPVRRFSVEKRSRAAAAATLAGKLLIAGVKDALVTPRFVQSVGRAMTLSDQALHGGANREHIGDAFARHGIMLGSNAMMAP